MILLIMIAIILVAIVGVGMIAGAPFVPTRRQWIDEALDVAAIGPNDVVVDLGSGDGAVLKRAVERGARRAIGYEINPILVVWSRLRLLKFRGRVQIRTANFFRGQLPPDATVIYLFQVGHIMKKLDRFLTQQRPTLKAKTVRVVCFGFKIPNRTPVKKSNGMRLYEL